MKLILKIILISLFLFPTISKADETKNPFLDFDAMYNASAKEIQSLIDQGYDVNELDNDGFTILHVMVSTKHKDIVTLLIKAGADVNVIKTRGGA